MKIFVIRFDLVFRSVRILTQKKHYLLLTSRCSSKFWREYIDSATPCLSIHLKGQRSVPSQIVSNVTADIVLESGVSKCWNSWNAALSHRLKIKISVNTSYK